MESLGLSRDRVVRCLQNVVGDYGQLPRRVCLPAVTERRYIGTGGEASIWIVKLKGKQVISRECPPPDGGDWDGDDGKQILKVSTVELYAGNSTGVQSTYSDLALRLYVEK